MGNVTFHGIKLYACVFKPGELAAAVCLVPYNYFCAYICIHVYVCVHACAPGFLQLFLCGHLYSCVHICVCVCVHPEAINN